jgi:hypothetical protein
VLPSGFSNQHAVVVGALNRDDQRASYSNGVGQAMWAVSAPGGESDSQDSCNSSPQGILSTFWTSDAPTSAYACLAGTSMAAPLVSGALAVLRSAGLTAQQAVDRLLATAHDLGATGADSTFGAGALDLAAAAAQGATQSTGSTVSTSPTATTAPATDGGPTSSTPTTDQSAGGLPPDSTTSTSSSGGATPPPPSSPPPLVTLPSRPALTSPEVAVRERAVGTGDDLPAGPVTVAALMAAGVASASGWFLIRGASWARRTPF